MIFDSDCKLIDVGVATMLEEAIERDRAAGYRPTVRIALTHQGQVLVGRKPTTLDAGRWKECPWDLFQGGIEPSEPLEEAFAREAREEVGSDFFFFRNAVEFLYRDSDERPVEKDGRQYRGKAYYVCTARLLSVPLYYDETTNGYDDEYIHDPLPYPGNEYWVLLMNYVKAQSAVVYSQRSKAPALLRAMHELRTRELLRPDGNGFGYMSTTWIRECKQKGIPVHRW